MQIGAWKNFDDLEESLTLDELMELHVGYVERMTNSAVLGGGGRSNSGHAPRPDIVKKPVKSGGDTFGVGSGLGHKQI